MNLQTKTMQNVPRKHIGILLENGEAVSVCRVMIRHARGEDVWNWGAVYSVRAATGDVIPGSIRCVGAG